MLGPTNGQTRNGFVRGEYLLKIKIIDVIANSVMFIAPAFADFAGVARVLPG